MPVHVALGHVVTMPGALELLVRLGQTPGRVLTRHARGDWGDLCEEDKAANDRALTEGERIFSSYRVTDTEKVWVITEADRSSTCILLPDEY